MSNLVVIEKKNPTLLIPGTSEFDIRSLHSPFNDPIVYNLFQGTETLSMYLDRVKHWMKHNDTGASMHVEVVYKTVRVRPRALMSALRVIEENKHPIVLFGSLNFEDTHYPEEEFFYDVLRVEIIGYMKLISKLCGQNTKPMAVDVPWYSDFQSAGSAQATNVLSELWGVFK